ncbi:DEKNAAC100311 [Brettanomyces naardenensis]|uniref:1,3-beta-glucan synthase n=1 Tax=Brettanomyces naardenensis TaxID=13370 RepID=A0A448YFC0_BRENA|nr:DEKNAAC100311 [Brettanomyces naardenensis]
MENYLLYESLDQNESIDQVASDREYPPDLMESYTRPVSQTSNGLDTNPIPSNCYPEMGQPSESFTPLQYQYLPYGNGTSGFYGGPESTAAPVDEDPYYSWTNDEMSPLSKEEIKDIFTEVEQLFGFQRDSAANTYDHLMVQLDSRASRMSAPLALLSLHADYIGGENANYRKWYFCCQQIEDPELFGGVNVKEIKRKLKEISDSSVANFYPKRKIEVIEFRWRQRMQQLSSTDLLRELALYLMIWGEANNLRFAPECLCFIFKCALDHMTFCLGQDSCAEPEEKDFLKRVINPLYVFYRDQQFKLVDGVFTRREKDHHAVIGYDDMNQLFWYHKGLERIVVATENVKLLSFPKEYRYSQLGNVIWKKAFYKTYREKRTWLHLVTNFSRVWIIHLSMFWYYSSFNSPTLYTADYQQMINNQPKLEATLSVTALGSTVGCLIQIIATICEWSYVPVKWPGSRKLFKRFVILIVITCVNFGPSVFVLWMVPLNATSQLALALSIAQFCVSVITTIWFSFQPLALLFEFFPSSDSLGYDPMTVFTASYPKLDSTSRVLSILLWVLVFAAKFIESYFFLTLSLRDPVRNLFLLDVSRCYGESIFGNHVCRYQAIFALGLMYLADIVLFFLDTYLWYIIWNCVMSLSLSFSSGMSILSPWRNIFTRLPQRIYSKLLSTGDMEVKYNPEVLVSQIWNAIVISLYREHLLSSDHVHRLIYDKLLDEDNGKLALRTPSFFLLQDDGNKNMSDFFVRNSEAERRISFFAQSLSTALPEPIPVEAMPTFTVLIPHYGEKILLTLREIIKEDPHSKMSLLEYLKHMFPHEWRYFVRDTKILSSNEDPDQDFKFESEKEYVENKLSDMPYYCVGFKTETPDYMLRTRIWASLRTQTLYRTVSGFLNYKKAIKLMHRVENPEMLEYFGGAENAEKYLNVMALRKVRLLVSVQRLQQFSDSEREDLHVLLRSSPEIKVSCLETDVSPSDGSTRYYSVLYEVTDDDDGNRLRLVYKIQLSGNPILGDGKSDNQNNALIFYRGEYIQVIDANQDNYLEECLKIRSVLAGFEGLEVDKISPYVHASTGSPKSPVAILGAREYIFSEHTGVLGDVAASKEQTFGTMFARTLAEIGAKLHYGHPDFINAIFMTTRGGISKAQKGLHLNEDIYAGMNAICRGGRIKHCDYYQCGKGRDLGFGSILNFTTKIGGGMGEQMLSREYYYLGSQMPLDRFLSFYYAHPGFHLNNLFIMLSLELFVLVAFNLGSMKHELIMCVYDKNVPITDLQIPLGCQNLQPVLDWVTRYVLSIFICFFISFLPLVLHELSERGPWKACGRLMLHFCCLSPLFEVFVCQIYATSLKNDIVFGGARYISTGRGFSISRVSFTKLYLSYAPTCIYSGMRLFLVLLFAVVTMWQPAILWFWITFASLCFSPFIFNPHQFSWTEFFLDYREFIRWLSRVDANEHGSSWISYIRNTRSRVTGLKRPKKGNGSSQMATANFSKPPFFNVFMADIFMPFIQTTFITTAYMFINAQNGVRNPVESNSLIRLGIVSLTPFLLNTIVLLCIFPLSCLAGPLLGLCCRRAPEALAALAHSGGLVVHVVNFEVIWALEGWNVGRAIACFTASIFVQRFLIETGKVLFLSREMSEDYGNRAWWSGKWITKGINWRYMLTQPLRELAVKIPEMSLFAADFMIGHVILFCITPLLFIPYIDHWHSCLLLWISPSKRLRGPIHTTSQRRLRRRRAQKYALLYLLIMVISLVIIAVPIIVGGRFDDMLLAYIPKGNFGLVQENNQNNNDTGEMAPAYILHGKPAEPGFSTYWI